MTTLVYGIKNCDTVKKALKWLEENQQQPKLHDYRIDGLEVDWLTKMEAKFGWQNLLNKRSTTWRNLDETTKKNINRNIALKLLAEQPTLIKRPIVIKNEITLLGFNTKEYQSAFAKN